MTRGLIGAVDTPGQQQQPPPGARYGLDNGCGPGKNGKPGKGYPGDDRWLKWVTEHPADRDLCLFAVAPDVLGDAAGTLARSAPWLPILRDLGYPAALVAQNGLEHLTIPWATFDVLFIGGDTAWKLGFEMAGIAREAADRGVPLHMGRVNSRRRLLIAERMGCRSADGTFLIADPDGNLDRIEQVWLPWIGGPVQDVLL